MRRFLSLCLAALSLPFLLHAQYGDLLENRQISWVAEYITDYELNPAYNDKLETELNLLELVRLTNPKGKNELYPDSDNKVPYYFSQQLFNDIRAGRLACFAGEDLQEPLTAEQIESRFHWKDATTTEDGGEFVAENEYTAENFVTFRVRQVLYFDAKKRSFGVRILAIAPVTWAADAEGYLNEQKPILWIKMPELTKKQEKDLVRDANYVVQTRLKENAPYPDQLSFRKGNFDLRAWADSEVEKPSHKVLGPEGFEPLSTSALHELLFTNDTLTALNAAGQNVIDKIVRNNALDDLEKIRLVQNWYYDERRHLLGCRLVAVAPVATITVAGGVFQFDKPLFYLKQ